MADEKDQSIIGEVEKHKEKIEEIDQSTIHSGVFQALHQLRKVLNALEKSLNERNYEEASHLGYNDVAHEFIFLQRTLGGLQGCTHERQKLIQDIAFQTNSTYDEIAPYVEQKMTSLKPRRKSEIIDIAIGEKSIEELRRLHEIRGTKTEDILEHIVAKELRENIEFWQELEEQKPTKRAKRDADGSISSDNMEDYWEELKGEVESRMDNLY